jgi:integrase
VKHCHKPKGECEQKTPHKYKRDAAFPEWHGWHAARRGLGSNLYRLDVAEKVIQRILRHANVSTTATYYIKTAADDVRSAMEKLENHISASAEIVQDTCRTLNTHQRTQPQTLQ